MSSKSIRTGLLLVLAASAASLAGCNNPGIRYNLTPGMMGTTTRFTDKQNNLAVTRNLNYRQLWDDLGRLGLADRPSRLTPVPMAH